MAKNKIGKEIEITSPDSIDKDLSKPLSFRCDSETYAKITTLEKARDESKAEVIKRAISQSYEVLLLRHINGKIFDVITELFGKPMSVKVYLENTTHKGEEDSDNPFIAENKAGTKSLTKYLMSDTVFTSNDESVNFQLNRYTVELKAGVDNRINLRFSVNYLIQGEISKFKPQIYFKILEIITKSGFKTETISEGKETGLSLVFERNAPIVSCKDWIANFKIDVKQVKQTLNEIKRYLESQKEIKKLANGQ